jgi:hypothetical protein
MIPGCRAARFVLEELDKNHDETDEGTKADHDVDNAEKHEQDG